MKDELGERMKSFYEKRSQTSLLRKVPVVLRLDGKAFHTFTKRCVKPFDEFLDESFSKATRYLMDHFGGCYFAYHQSDEVSVVLLDIMKAETTAVYDYKVQKLTSVSASIFTYAFNKEFRSEYPAFFDSRAFNIPFDDLPNYFVWRQKNCIRNSVSLLGRKHFSQKQLNGKNVEEVKEMLLSKGYHWEFSRPEFKFGTVLTKNNSYRSQFDYSGFKHMLEDIKG